MTSIETKTDLKVGEIFNSNGKGEIVTEVFYEGEKLARFRTLRRHRKGNSRAILESAYSVDGPGKITQSFSGIHFGKETPPFHASERYSELDKFLREWEK